MRARTLVPTLGSTRGGGGSGLATLVLLLALPPAGALAQSDAPDLDRDGIPDVLESPDDRGDDQLGPDGVSEDPETGRVRRGIIVRESRHAPLPTADARDEDSARVEDDLDRTDREPGPDRSLRPDRPMLRSPWLPRIVHAGPLQTELGAAVGIGAFDIPPDTLLAVPIALSLETAAAEGRLYFGAAWASGAGQATPDVLLFAPGGLQAWVRYVARLGPRLALGAGGGVGAPVYDSDDPNDRLAADRVMFTHLPDRLLLEFDLIAARAFFDVAYRAGILFLQARAGLDLWIPIGNREDLEVGLRGIVALGFVPADVAQGGLELAVVSIPTVSEADSISKTDFRLALFGEVGGRQTRVGLDAWIGLDHWGPSELSLGATLRVHALF